VCPTPGAVKCRTDVGAPDALSAFLLHVPLDAAGGQPLPDARGAKGAGSSVGLSETDHAAAGLEHAEHLAGTRRQLPRSRGGLGHDEVCEVVGVRDGGEVALLNRDPVAVDAGVAETGPGIGHGLWVTVHRQDEQVRALGELVGQAPCATAQHQAVPTLDT